MWGHSKKTPSLNQKEGPYFTLTLAIQVPDTGKEISIIYKSPMYRNLQWNWLTAMVVDWVNSPSGVPLAWCWPSRALALILMLLYQSAWYTFCHHEIIVLPDLTGVNDSPKLPSLLLNCVHNRITINSSSSQIIFVTITLCTCLSAK